MYLNYTYLFLHKLNIRMYGYLVPLVSIHAFKFVKMDHMVAEFYNALKDAAKDLTIMNPEKH